MSDCWNLTQKTCFLKISALLAQLSACSCLVFTLPVLLILKLLLIVLCEMPFTLMIWSKITECIWGWRTKRRWDVHPQSYSVCFDTRQLQWAKCGSVPSLIQYNWQLARWTASVQLINIDKARLWLLIASKNNTSRSPSRTEMQSDCSALIFQFGRGLDKRYVEIVAK